MQDIVTEDVEAGTSGGMGDEYITDEEETSEAGRLESASSLENDFIYDGGNRSWYYKQSRYLVSARDIVNVSQSAFHIIDILEIGNTAKVSVDTRAHYNSRNQIWFTTNKKRE